MVICIIQESENTVTTVGTREGTGVWTNVEINMVSARLTGLTLPSHPWRNRINVDILACARFS